MTARQSMRRRWSTAARWPLGVMLTAWRYLWQTTPTHRWELSGSWPEDAPPTCRAASVRSGSNGWMTALARSSTGSTGRGSWVGVDRREQLMRRMAQDLDCVAPSEFATFQRVRVNRARSSQGDEYVVRMPGPWDGPVRVVAPDSSSFTLATLDGHLEAGQIQFRVGADYRSLIFEIESWARSGDRLSDLFYTHLRLSKEVQLHMWSSVLRQIVKLAEGRMDGGIVITTRVVSPSRSPGEHSAGKLRTANSAISALAIARSISTPHGSTIT